MIAIILQIIGFIALAYLAVKFAPNILNAVFKLSVIVVAFIIIMDSLGATFVIGPDLTSITALIFLCSTST